jgi:hypothetical protein
MFPGGSGRRFLFCGIREMTYQQKVGETTGSTYYRKRLFWCILGHFAKGPKVRFTWENAGFSGFFKE